MKTDRHHLISLSLIILLYLYLNLNLIFTKPAIWPDEAVYFDTAYNFISNGKLATNLWKGLVPGVEQMALWNPPFFFLMLAHWLNLTGFSLLNQRLLSTLFGALTLILLYTLSQKLTQNKYKWSGIIACVAAIADFHFLRASRISRPEIFVLFFILLSLNILYSSNLFKNKHLQYFFSGLCLSLSILIHPLALFFSLFFPAYFFLEKITDKKTVSSFIFGLTTPVVLWLLIIQKYWNILIEQMQLAAIKKFSETTWILIAFNNNNINLKIIYISFIFATVFIFKFIWQHKKNRELIYCTVLLFIAWFMAIYGRMFWYFAYISPFLALSFAKTISIFKPKKIHTIPFLILAFMVINIIYTFSDFSTIKSAAPSYIKFSQAVLAKIPTDATVYLSSTPDPYYGFFDSKRTNKLIEFPVYPLDKNLYLEVLNQADFIVTSGNQEELIFGSLFPDYIGINSLEQFQVGQGSGYTATVIKLKPKEDRVSPIIGKQ